MPNTLQGRRILVTRPQAQAQGLCAQIQAAGGEALIFPVLDIQVIADTGRIMQDLQQAPAEIAIFISANAVEHGLPLLLATGAKPQIAAVGKATARALQAQGVAVDLCPPSQFDSEGLLDLPALQSAAVQGRRVVIFRGLGGRPTLGDTLQQRGAQLSYAEVYQRCLPDLPQALPDWAARGAIDAVILSSSEGLQNLFKMLQSASWLYQRPLIVISERTRSFALDMGVQGPVFVATQASDAGLFAALQEAVAD